MYEARIDYLIDNCGHQQWIVELGKTRRCNLAKSSSDSLCFFFAGNTATSDPLEGIFCHGKVLAFTEHPGHASREL